MRSIGHIDNETDARRFGDFLYVQNVANSIERDGATWTVWVHDDDHLKKAGEWLTTFRSNPADPQFQTTAAAEQKRDEEKKDLKDYQKRFRTRRDVFPQFGPYGLGKLTAFLMAISIVVAILSRLGSAPQNIMPLFITNWIVDGDYVVTHQMPEIRNGELWRLFTPMFIHFGPMHIIFNMLWLRDLGSMIEGRESMWRLLFLVLVGAAISNLAQYLIYLPSLPRISGGSPNFGGMSGVVYALLGYIWIRGKLDRGSGLFLHKSTVTMMLIWLVVCFTGLLGHIANLAHLFGLIVGVVLGFLFSLPALQRR